MSGANSLAMGITTDLKWGGGGEQAPLNPSSHLHIKSHSYPVLVFGEVPEGSQVFCISHGRLQTSSEGHVDVEAHSWSAAHLHAHTHKTSKLRENQEQL